MPDVIGAMLLALFLLTLLTGAKTMDGLARIRALVERFASFVAADKQAAVDKAIADTKAEYDGKIAELEAQIAVLVGGIDNSANG